MTLEQRVEVLEKAVANMKLSNAQSEELSKIMGKVAKDAIKSAKRPGGLLHKKDEKAAIEVAAFEIKSGAVNISAARISASDSV
jgi:hypothetical protein